MEQIETYLSSDFWQSAESKSFLHESQPNLNEVSGAVYFQTSGSSGIPKIVVHHKKTLLASAKLVVNWLEVTSDDRWYLALPIHHVGGFGVLARSYVSGCKVIQHQGKWSAEQCLEQMISSIVTIVSLVPTQVYDLVKAELTAPVSLRAVVVGGGKIDVALKNQALALGWNILETYGMSETGSMIATQRSASDKGIELINGWQARVNDQGLLEAKGPGLMLGYAKKTPEGFKLIEPFVDGWFKSSDKVEIIENHLVFKSRNDRVVKILGELVDLEVIENELEKSVGFEVNVIDIPDDRRGVLLVSVVENEKERGVLNKCIIHSSFAKGLRQLSDTYICSQLPRKQMGKLDRQSLRDSIVKFIQTS